MPDSAKEPGLATETITTTPAHEDLRVSDELLQLVRELHEKVDLILNRLDAVEASGERRERLAHLDLLPAASPESPPAPPASRTAFDEAIDFEIPPARFTSPRELLTALFHSATLEDEPTGFAIFLSCQHTENTSSKLAVAQLRSFNWKQLRKNAPLYLPTGNADSFRVARSEPLNPDRRSARSSSSSSAINATRPP